VIKFVKLLIFVFNQL